MKSYKTLYYLRCCGVDLEEELKQGRYNIAKGTIKRCLSDYELKYYHCKVLKMPLSTYDKAGLIMAILHNAIAETEQAEADRLQALQDQQERNEARTERKEQTKLAIKIILWSCLLVLVFCLGAVFVLWALA